MSKSRCSLCGSDGTNKSTCPMNPLAKNPNLAKHPKSEFDEHINALLKKDSEDHGEHEYLFV